jgi:hypothetical protein
MVSMIVVFGATCPLLTGMLEFFYSVAAAEYLSPRILLFYTFSTFFVWMRV